MRYVIATVLAGLALWLWLYVYQAIRAGFIMRPNGNVWWREPRYYDRDSETIRFWMTAGVWGVLGLLASAAAISSLMAESLAT